MNTLSPRELPALLAQRVELWKDLTLRSQGRGQRGEAGRPGMLGDGSPVVEELVLPPPR